MQDANWIIKNPDGTESVKPGSGYKDVVINYFLMLISEPAAYSALVRFAEEEDLSVHDIFDGCLLWIEENEQLIAKHHYMYEVSLEDELKPFIRDFYREIREWEEANPEPSERKIIPAFELFSDDDGNINQIIMYPTVLDTTGEQDGEEVFS